MTKQVIGINTQFNIKIHVKIDRDFTFSCMKSENTNNYQ